MRAIFPQIDLLERKYLNFGCSCEFCDIFKKIYRGLYILYMVSINTTNSYSAGKSAV